VQAVEEVGGVGVLCAPLPDGVSGAYNPDVPLVFVNRHHAVVRQRFTVAHEFGHHRCGHADLKIIDTDDDLRGRTSDPREVQANAFAAEFLAPKVAVERWWAQERGDAVGLEAVCRLAYRFGLSALAALFRIDTARVVPAAAVRRMRGEIVDDELHLQIGEQLDLGDPIDDELARIAERREIRLPAAFRGSVLEAVLHGRMDRVHGARLAGVAPAALDAAIEGLLVP
jgi:Zn-dependent peptidase ImmA (M78 family)